MYRRGKNPHMYPSIKSGLIKYQKFMSDAFTYSMSRHGLYKGIKALLVVIGTKCEVSMQY